MIKVTNTKYATDASKKTILVDYWNRIPLSKCRSIRQRAAVPASIDQWCNGIIKTEFYQHLVNNEEFPENILKNFKFKSFEFGRYTENDARFDFIAALSFSFAKFKYIINTNNFGMNAVRFAYGSRGHPGASGHFEPYYNIINLIKNDGSIGVLCHEYAHALDYNFGVFIEQHTKHQALSSSLNENNPGYFRQTVGELVKYGLERLRNKTEYSQKPQEVFARLFEQVVSFHYETHNIQDANFVRSFKTYCTWDIYWTEKQIKEIYPKFMELFKNFEDVMNGKTPSGNKLKLPQASEVN